MVTSSISVRAKDRAGDERMEEVRGEEEGRGGEERPESRWTGGESARTSERLQKKSKMCGGKVNDTWEKARQIKR